MTRLTALACALACLACTPKPAPAKQDQVIAHVRDAGPAPNEPRVSALGSDVSELPTRYPQASWLPLRGTLGWPTFHVDVQVNGETVTAQLDTGAMNCVMSEQMADRLGLIGEDGLQGKRVSRRNANGSVVDAVRISVGTIAIGAHRWEQLAADVVRQAPADLLLIGADVLSDVDVYFASDEGLVGFFERGAAPVPAGGRVVEADVRDRELLVFGMANGANGPVRIPFIVDSGASTTSVPIVLGSAQRLHADTSYEALSLGAGGDAQERRGRFVLDPLAIGARDNSVGKVLALGTPVGDAGLLGADVLVRQHVLASVGTGRLVLAPPAPRPAVRTRGPGGVRCPLGPCVKVAVVEKPGTYAVDDIQGVCLQIDVDKAYAGRTIELLVTTADRDLLDGGSIHLFVSAAADGVHLCRPLWRQLAAMGVRAGTPLSLRWVRTEGIQWPCDALKTQCQRFNGPLK